MPPDALAYATKKPEGSYASCVVDLSRNGFPACDVDMWSCNCLNALSTANELDHHACSRDDSHLRTKPIITLSSGWASAASTTGFESATSIAIGFSSSTC